MKSDCLHSRFSLSQLLQTGFFSSQRLCRVLQVWLVLITIESIFNMFNVYLPPYMRFSIDFHQLPFDLPVFLRGPLLRFFLRGPGSDILAKR